MRSVNVTPLYPGREPAIYEVTNPAHLPCPDMACYSLNQAQKERGLSHLAQVRKFLREQQLLPLREKTKQLQEQGRATDDLGEQRQIANEIKNIESQAKAISKRWS